MVKYTTNLLIKNPIANIFYMLLGLTLALTVLKIGDFYTLYQSFGLIIAISVLISLFVLSITRIEWALFIFLSIQPILYMVERLIHRYFFFGFEWIIITPGTILLFVIAFGLIFQSANRFKDIVVKSQMDLPFLLLIIAGILSILGSYNPTLSSKYFFKGIIEPIIFYFIVLHSIKTNRQIRVVLYGIVTCAVLLSTYLLYFYIGNIELFNPETIEQFRDISGEWDAGIAGTIAILALSLVFGLLFSAEKSKFKFIFLVLSLILLLATIFFSYTRIIWLSFIVLSVAWTRNKRFRGYLLLSFVIFFLLISSGDSLEYFRYRSITLSELLTDTSVSARLCGWRNSLEMLKDHPITGIGMGMYRYLYPSYMDPGTDAYLVSAHNVFLHIAAEMGIFGLLGLIWLFTKAIRTALQRPSDEISFALFTGLACYLIISLTSGFSGFVHMTAESRTWLITPTLIFYAQIAITSIFCKNSSVSDDAFPDAAIH